MIIPIFIPHGGCPERCKFCDQKVSGGEVVSNREVAITIEKYLLTRKVDEKVDCAFYGGTFTALSRELQLKYLDTIKPFLELGLIENIRIATRPDSIEKLWLEKLQQEYGLDTVELGIQSFDEEVLAAAGRSHTHADVLHSTQIIKELNLKLGMHLILGLPCEKSSEDQNSLGHLLALKPDFARIHPLLVIQNTFFASEYQAGNLRVLTLEEAVKRAAFLTHELEENGIQVIRLGLQPNEKLSSDVIAGPNHPSFGELVRGRIVAMQLKKEGKASSQECENLPMHQLRLLRAHGNYNLNWMMQS